MDAFVEDQRLYLHRSWTGCLRYSSKADIAASSARPVDKAFRPVQYLSRRDWRDVM
jgi:hypothetical protein